MPPAPAGNRARLTSSSREALSGTVSCETVVAVDRPEMGPVWGCVRGLCRQTDQSVPKLLSAPRCAPHSTGVPLTR